MGAVERAYQRMIRQARGVTVDFTETVSVETLTSTDDGMGGQTTVPQIIATYLGKRRPAGGDVVQERLLAEQLAPRALYIISLPYNTTVPETAKLLMGSKRYDIIQVMERTDQIETRIAAVEV